MKIIIKTVFAVLFFVQLVLFALSLPAPATQAETIPQYRQRIIQEYIDRFSLTTGCDATCLEPRLAGNASWLVPLAAQVAPFKWQEHPAGPAEQTRQIDWVNFVTRGSIGYSIQWGFDFESNRHKNTDCALRSTPTDNKCAPSRHDWEENWLAISDSYRSLLLATPPLCKLNLWVDGGHQRMCRWAWEYGGPY